MITKARKDALQICLLSLLALFVFFVLPEPVNYKGPAAEFLPLAKEFIIACGLGGIFYSFYLFLKER
ncbi:MAG: hypothetical protein WC608_02490 [Parcubacteria group bacterium]